ncbi:glycosyl hydrolases family 38 N-terminal domain-containing protein [Mycena sp. CBHHK59/15]|nr:glycosyl hydrolases family 38 N-terminal domain-containing protein [Mycena sp. CBHHK59/15]
MSCHHSHSRPRQQAATPAYPALNCGSGAKWIKNLTKDRCGRSGSISENLRYTLPAASPVGSSPAPEIPRGLHRIGPFNGGHFGTSILVELTTGCRWSAPGLSKPTFAEAMKQEFKEAHKGDAFGPSWVCSAAALSARSLGVKSFAEYGRVQFEFDPGCEAMSFDTDGTPLQGIMGGYGDDRRVEYIIPEAAHKKGTHEIVIESSCNGMFGMAGAGIGSPDPNRYFRLDMADVVLVDTLPGNTPCVSVSSLLVAFAFSHILSLQLCPDPYRLVLGRRLHLPDSPPFARPSPSYLFSPFALYRILLPSLNKALVTANAIMNAFSHTDPTSIKRARHIAEDVFGEGWGCSARASTTRSEGRGALCGGSDSAYFSSLFIRLASPALPLLPSSSPFPSTTSLPPSILLPLLIPPVCSCHIDTAWRWLFSVTQQKTARSWATQIDLMERYPEHRSACSRAQQYKCLQQQYSILFERFTTQVLTHKFHPIGGSWAENDANMPSGEALVRQFLFGQRYFESHFGKRCETAWLPDSFGLTGALPQLIRGAGMKYFFTQKLNNINNFPHSTFNWVGIDGTQVLCHMTPVDTYTAQATVGDVNRAVTNHKNLESSDTSLLVFGNGGPLPKMLENLHRMRAVTSTHRELPPVNMGHSVNEFFDYLAESTKAGKVLPNWHGELHLEFHRGTYTSNGSIKKGNRNSEILLRDVEHVATLASQREQEKVLLNQFHDLLPESAIDVVYDDAEKLYAEVRKGGEKMLDDALDVILGGAQRITRSTHITVLEQVVAKLLVSDIFFP